MDMQKELIIPFDKADAQLAYTVSSIFFLVIASIILILTTVSLLPTISLQLFYLLLVLKIFFASIAMVFAWMFYNSCKIIKATGPAMILNAKGIAMGNFGLIPWDSIESISILNVFSTANGIELIIKNDSLPLIWKQCSFQGKRIIFWAKLLRNPCCIDFTFPSFNKEIISFSQHYLPNNSVKKLLNETTVCKNSTEKHLCLRCHDLFECEEIDHKQAEYYVCHSCMHKQAMRYWH